MSDQNPSDEGFDRVRSQIHEGIHALKRRARVLKEFKDFVSRGSALDLAVGVVIGAAFNSVVNSLVKDVLTPIIAWPGTANFDSLRWCLKAGEAGCGVEFAYGRFLTTLISFLLTSAAVFFFVVHPMHRMRARGELQAPETRECPECLTAIPVRARRCSACTAVLPSG